MGTSGDCEDIKMRSGTSPFALFLTLGSLTDAAAASSARNLSLTV